MGKLLFDEPPLTVSPSLAVIVGLEEAIVLQQVKYWLTINEEKKANYFNGRYWVYNSYREWQKQFPFWSERTVRRIIGRLESRGLLISDNHNEAGFDKTKWYTIDYEELTRHEAAHKAMEETAAG